MHLNMRDMQPRGPDVPRAGVLGRETAPTRLAILIGGFILQAAVFAGAASPTALRGLLVLSGSRLRPLFALSPSTSEEGPPSRQPRRLGRREVHSYAQHIAGILRRLVAPDVSRSRAREAKLRAPERFADCPIRL